MDNREDKEIQNALNEKIEDMEFEEIPETNDSPINEPVVSGEVSTAQINVKEAQESTGSPAVEQIYVDDAPELSEESFNEIQDEVESTYQAPSDAPEQIVDAEEDDENDSYGAGSELKVPDSHAALAADSLLGIANNGLELGGNFFVKIKKSREVMQFKTARKIIDGQNKKNIERLKLDAEDKALLKPILMEVLKKRAKELTPEQQLIAASISILTKKVQLAVEMRAEGKIIAENIRNAVREEIKAAEEDDREDKEADEIEVIEVEDTEIGKAA